MKLHKALFLLAYTALLTTGLVVLSQGKESRVMRIVHREVREMKAQFRKSGEAAERQVKLIEAHYRQAEQPDAPKTI
jgi:hypothetical protein